MPRPQKLMVIAAEASGDELGAEFITSVKEIAPDIAIKGMGGEKMAKAGVTSEVSIDGLSILGLFEALGAWQTARNKAKEIAEVAKNWGADTAVLIDSWGFSLRAGKALKQAIPNIRLIKMVGPQVWATRAGRAKVLAAVFDELWCIHQFELKFYQGLPIKTSVIGNPALSRLDINEFKNNNKREYIGILPGSRNNEINRLLPTMLKAAKEIHNQRGNQFLLIVAEGKQELINSIINIEGLDKSDWIHFANEDNKKDAFGKMKAAIACSGTVTTELALAEVPIVLGYRLDTPTYFIAKNFLLKSKYVNLLNVAMDKEIIPELLQKEFNINNIIKDIYQLLDNQDYAKQQIELQNTALKKMGLGRESSASIAAKLLIE